jgi:hypothetical protein
LLQASTENNMHIKQQKGSMKNGKWNINRKNHAKITTTSVNEKCTSSINGKQHA